MSTKKLQHHLTRFRKSIKYTLAIVLLASVGPIAVAAFSQASLNPSEGNWYLTLFIALVMGLGGAFMIGRKVLFDLFAIAERATLSEARLRRLMEFSGDWYWQQDANHVLRNIIYRGREIGDTSPTNELPFVDKARRDVPGLSLLEPNLDWDKFDELMESRKAFDKLRFEYRQPGRITLIFESTGRPVYTADETFLGYEGVSSNVTQKVLNERLLTVQRYFLQGVLLSAPLSELVNSYARGLKTCLANRCELVIGYRYQGVNGRWAIVGASPSFRVPAEFDTSLWVDPMSYLEEIPGIETNSFIQVGKIKPDALPTSWSDQGITSAWVALRKAAEPNEPEYWMLVAQTEVAEPDKSDVMRALMAIRLLGLCVERRGFEDELMSFNQTLEERIVERTAELTQTNSELEAFTYTVSHDLRAPLRAIDGFSTILREDFEDKLPADAVGLLNRISSNARQMGGLIDGLLDFSRLLRTEITRVDVNLQDMLANVFEQLDARKRATVEVDELPHVTADPVLIQQVWMNLIDNALKFSAKTQSPSIKITCTRLSNGWQFSVQDNGAGFDMKFADKLFKVFERLHHQKDFSGTGVGLAIVKRIIERHGGEIKATSEPGQGACFTFSIIDAPSQEAAHAA